MEAGGVTKDANRNTLHATAQLLPSQRFPIHKWEPRTGYNEDYIKWKLDVDQLAHALGMDPLTLFSEQGPPYVNTATSGLVTRSSFKGATNEVTDEHRRIATEWLTANTSFYWHLRPSIIIDGPYLVEDTSRFNRLVNGSLADGRGLFRWAASKADVTSVESQGKIVTALNTIKLKAGSTCAQINAHTQGLLARWQLVSANSIDNPKTFWQQLCYSMPTEPEGCHVASLRAWLANRISEFNNPESPLRDTEIGIEHMLEYAAILGIPPGKAVSNSSVLNVLASLECEGCLALDEPSGGGQVNQMGDGKKPTWTKAGQKPTNDCTFCDAYACKSNKVGGSAKCISRHDSSFDLTKLSSGAAKYCRTARAYHKTHSSSSTLKGIRFTIKKKPKANEGEATEASSVQAIGMKAIAGEDATEEGIDAWLNDILSQGTASGLHVIGEPRRGFKS